MATAKRRALDFLRRNKMMDRKHEQLGREIAAEQVRTVPDLDAAIDDDIGDDPIVLLEALNCLHLRADNPSPADLRPAPGIGFRVQRAS